MKAQTWKAYNMGETDADENEQDHGGEENEPSADSETPIICYALFPDGSFENTARETLFEPLSGFSGRAEMGSLNAMSADKPQNNKVKITSIVDSGAARSVCPANHAQQFPVVETEESRRGIGFKTATGKRVQVVGGKTVVGVTAEGKKLAMNYTVAPVRVPLDSVSQICDSGASVIFTRTGGKTVDADGSETVFHRVDNTYVREVWVDRQLQKDGSAAFTWGDTSRKARSGIELRTTTRL